MPPKKRANKNDQSQTQSQPSQPAAKKSGKKAAKQSNNADDSNTNDATVLGSTLVSALCSGAAVATVVSQFINALQEDAATACAAIINAVCQAAGVKDVGIDARQVEDHSGISTALEELFARVPTSGAEAATAYFLINKEAQYKRFRKNFPQFFERLVIASFSAGVLHDDGFLPVLTPWLAAISESKARAFRHTAALALFAIIQGLNDRITMLSETLQAAKKKDAVALQGKYDAVVALQGEIFALSVHQRVKDVAPEIRLLAVQSLKHYLLNAPDLYLNNNFLRYLVLSFHDKRSDIRCEALDFLVQALTSLSRYHDRMRDFIRHIAPRLVQMTGDVETKCADLALKAAAMIIKTDFDRGESEEGSATFDHDMIDAILMCLMDDRLAIRHSAGLLLKVFIRSSNAEQSDEEEARRMRCQTLGFLALTLHDQYNEPLAETYLVDALWRDVDPPSLLADVETYVSNLASENVAEASSSLRLLTAIVRRAQNHLELGPAAKDDIKHTSTKTKGEVDLPALVAKITKDLVGLLEAILEKFVGDSSVVKAAADFMCACDLASFTAQRSGAPFKSTLAAFRRATASMRSGDKDVSVSLSNLWRTVAFTDHPHKAEGESQLHELLRTSLRQLANRERSAGGSSSQKDASELEDAWARVELLAGLIALPDQWGLFNAALTRYSSDAEALPSPALLSSVVNTAVCTQLWEVGALQADPSRDAELLSGNITDLASSLLRVAAFDSQGSEYLLDCRINALVRALDLAALPYTLLPQADQEGLVGAVTDVTEECNEILRSLYDRHKDQVAAMQVAEQQQQQGGANAASQASNRAARTSALTALRKVISTWEAHVVRLASGLVRLFAFESIDESLAARALLLWTRSPLKTASDLYKTLFHNIRDRNSALKPTASQDLEESVLNAAYNHCAALGLNQVALEQFYQVGQKLASMHFLGTDKHYPAAVHVVRYAIEFAETTDPTILHAIIPYCAKLRQADALNMANNLNNSELFRSGTNAFVKSFVGAIRRAAKLDDVGTGRASRAGLSTKRGRASAAAPSAAAAGGDEAYLADIAAGATNPRAKKRPDPTNVTPARVVDEDGWRRVDASAAVAAQLATPADEVFQAPKPGGKRGAKAAPKPSPNTATIASMLGDLDSEVFIATQEWE